MIYRCLDIVSMLCGSIKVLKGRLVKIYISASGDSKVGNMLALHAMVCIPYGPNITRNNCKVYPKTNPEKIISPNCSIY